MKRLLMVVAAMAIAGTAVAGPNAGGTIFVHDAGVAYTGDITVYCGVGNGPATCEDADVQIDGTAEVVWKVYAAFPEGSSPRLKAVAFGILYENITLLAQADCAGFELADPSWPASGAGTSLVFTETRTTQLTECYWFGGYNYDGGGNTFALIPNAEQGGVFADDSIPSLVDEITGYGILGFNVPGETACPAAPQEGACCLSDGSCVLTLPGDCQGEFVGGPCDPNPCDVPPEPGACCLDTGECLFVLETECQGNFVGGPCDPNPCPVIPVQESSWGQIKNNYR